VPDEGVRAAVAAGCRELGQAIASGLDESGASRTMTVDIVLGLTDPASQRKSARSPEARALRELIGAGVGDVGLMEVFARAISPWQPLAAFQLTALSKALGIERLLALIPAKLRDQAPSGEELLREVLSLMAVDGVATGLARTLAALGPADLERARDHADVPRDLTYALVQLLGLPADVPAIRFLERAPNDWRLQAGTIVCMAATFKRSPELAERSAELHALRVANLSESQLAKLRQILGTRGDLG
jgi:hypothetical protein